MGRKKRPMYRIVVMDSKKPRDGEYIEKIGLYNPLTDPATVEVDKAKALDWMSKGAIPTDTVYNIFQKEGIILENHLNKNVSDEKARNIEMQKWELAKKEQNEVQTEVESKVEVKEEVKEETVETPETADTVVETEKSVNSDNTEG